MVPSLLLQSKEGQDQLSQASEGWSPLSTALVFQHACEDKEEQADFGGLLATLGQGDVHVRPWSVLLLQMGSVLTSMTHVAIKGHMHACCLLSKGCAAS